MFGSINNTKILNVTQKCFYSKFISGSYKVYLGLTQSDGYFCSILTKSSVCQEVFIKYPNMKFQGNVSSGKCIDTYGHIDRQTDMTKLLDPFHDSANMLTSWSCIYWTALIRPRIFSVTFSCGGYREWNMRSSFVSSTRHMEICFWYLDSKQKPAVGLEALFDFSLVSLIVWDSSNTVRTNPVSLPCTILSLFYKSC